MSRLQMEMLILLNRSGNSLEMKGIYVVGLVSAIPVAISAFSETGYKGYRLAPSGACEPGHPLDGRMRREC